MKRYTLFLVVGGLFLAASAVVYLIHYFIFHDVHHIFIYMVGDLAFLPIEVFLVVIVIERILSRREKQAMLRKLNMVIGAFFSEVGNNLLGNLLPYIKNRDDLIQNLDISKFRTDEDYKKADAYTNQMTIHLDMHQLNLEKIKSYLKEKRAFLLALMENPNLLEHDLFTDLLWAVTHLQEELDARPSLTDLPEQDLQHIAVDIQRMYGRLAGEWLDYAEHLKNNYPYLHSLILRTHPFQQNPSAVVAE